MTPEALREKVARAIGNSDTPAIEMTLRMADRAIAVVLEEAARVADGKDLDIRWSGTAADIAAAIRGLITSPESAAPDADQSRAIR
jgi:hypothetical protein